MANSKPAKRGLNAMRGMKPRQALDYFFAHYSLHLIIFVMAVLFLVLLIRGSIGAERREALLRGVLIAPGFSEEGTAEGTAAFAAYLSLDEETQYVEFQAVPGLSGAPAEGMQQVLSGVVARRTDVLAGDAAQVDYLLKNGAVSDLSAVLPGELLETWAGDVYYVDTQALSAWSEARKSGNEENPVLVLPSPAGMTQAVPVALDVTKGCEAVFGRHADGGAVLLCVSVSTDRLDAAAAFLEFLSLSE